MAAIVISWSLQPQNIHSVIKALSSDCYLRIDNRPVLFVYGIYSIPKELLDATKAAAKEAGIKEELFLVCMSTTDVFAIHTMRERGFEAISKYACGAFAPNEPYVELAKRAYDGNIKQYDYSKTIRSIPLITFGRDSRPRIETKLSFCGDYGGMFAFPPTDEELYNHITQVTQYMLDHKELNEINSVVMYAWNEHDEGGWICPTLAVDQNGEPIKDENGKNKMNRSHLDVLKRAISDYRKKENK